MGLTIRACSHVVPVRAEQDDATRDVERVVSVFVPFYLREEEPTREWLRPLTTGYYEVSGDQLYVQTGQDAYHALLAALDLVTSEEEGVHQGEEPFAELREYSDCEGALGTDVCRKLLGDFLRFEPRMHQYPDEQVRQLYQLLLGAFQVAAKDGLIILC